MAKKNTINLNFNYNYWSAPVVEANMTKSINKMKKLLIADIKNVLINGYKRYGEREAAAKIQLPFIRNRLGVDADIKVTFDDDCKFKCEKLTEILKTRTQFGEVTVDGTVMIAVVWKF